MIELGKKELEQVNGGFFFGIPSSCVITVTCYAAAKILFSDEPITEEGLMTSAFLGLILDAGDIIG